MNLSWSFYVKLYEITTAKNIIPRQNQGTRIIMVFVVRKYSPYI
jgi:hypothetical protein